MKIRFLADADLNKNIVRGVLKPTPEIDFKVALELQGLPDPQVLAYAAREGRILVTNDRRSMSVHFGEFIQTQNSPGVFIISQNISVRRAIDELILFWAASEAEEHINLIRNLFP
ncbi:MAG TPA: DUF5615 family PIN-like protein [Pyrinomonadaceae bacterium]|nr:DUF5615 family PIN-like protein [Pyrinomonadaceae bacterium]